MEHSSPVEGTTCLSCWEDLSSENYVEYQHSADSPWLPSGFCYLCINHLLQTQWQSFKTRLATTNCKAEARRMIERGPPINIRDSTALPCPDDGEVYSLWVLSLNEIISPKLEGSPIGEEREKYWNEMRSFYLDDEKDEEVGKENAEDSANGASDGTVNASEG